VEKACGLRPTAFRAPNLSISEITFEVLLKLRYTLDSSVPARRLLGFKQITDPGYFGAPLRPYYPSTQNLRLDGGNTILEVPPSAFLVPLNMSALRVLGLKCLMLAAHRVARQSPVLVFYAHPVEFELPEKQEISSSEPARYRRGLGPQNIDLLARFVDSLLSRGYTPVTLSSFANVETVGSSRVINGA
jgi:peptidoglycan/xylan/chitin deacetylase (PgdA/CDA1 family)